MCESAACTFDHKVLCREVFRVLKPGARFTGFDWQMTDKVRDICNLQRYLCQTFADSV
jgi:hypothetical protein